MNFIEILEQDTMLTWDQYEEFKGIRCDRCKHWDTEAGFVTEYEAGKCLAIDRPTVNVAGAVVLASDGEDCDVMTKPDFFCKAFEAK